MSSFTRYSSSVAYTADTIDDYKYKIEYAIEALERPTDRTGLEDNELIRKFNAALEDVTSILHASAGDKDLEGELADVIDPRFFGRLSEYALSFDLKLNCFEDVVLRLLKFWNEAADWFRGVGYHVEAVETFQIILLQAFSVLPRSSLCEVVRLFQDRLLSIDAKTTVRVLPLLLQTLLPFSGGLFVGPRPTHEESVLERLWLDLFQYKGDLVLDLLRIIKSSSAVYRRSASRLLVYFYPSSTNHAPRANAGISYPLPSPWDIEDQRLAPAAHLLSDTVCSMVADSDPIVCEAGFQLLYGLFRATDRAPADSVRRLLHDSILWMDRAHEDRYDISVETRQQFVWPWMSSVFDSHFNIFCEAFLPTASARVRWEQRPGEFDPPPAAFDREDSHLNRKDMWHDFTLARGLARLVKLHEFPVFRKALHELILPYWLEEIAVIFEQNTAETVSTLPMKVRSLLRTVLSAAREYFRTLDNRSDTERRIFADAEELVLVDRRIMGAYEPGVANGTVDDNASVSTLKRVDLSNYGRVARWIRMVRMCGTTVSLEVLSRWILRIQGEAKYGSSEIPTTCTILGMYVSSLTTAMNKQGGNSIDWFTYVKPVLDAAAHLHANMDSDVSAKDLLSATWPCAAVLPGAVHSGVEKSAVTDVLSECFTGKILARSRSMQYGAFVWMYLELLLRSCGCASLSTAIPPATYREFLLQVMKAKPAISSNRKAATIHPVELHVESSLPLARLLQCIRDPRSAHLGLAAFVRLLLLNSTTKVINHKDILLEALPQIAASLWQFLQQAGSLELSTTARAYEGVLMPAAVLWYASMVTKSKVARELLVNSIGVSIPPTDDSEDAQRTSMIKTARQVVGAIQGILCFLHVMSTSILYTEDGEADAARSLAGGHSEVAMMFLFLARGLTEYADKDDAYAGAIVDTLEETLVSKSGPRASMFWVYADGPNFIPWLQNSFLSLYKSLPGIADQVELLRYCVVLVQELRMQEHWFGCVPIPVDAPVLIQSLEAPDTDIAAVELKATILNYFYCVLTNYMRTLGYLEGETAESHGRSTVVSGTSYSMTYGYSGTSRSRTVTTDPSTVTGSKYSSRGYSARDQLSLASLEESDLFPSEKQRPQKKKGFLSKLFKKSTAAEYRYSVPTQSTMQSSMASQSSQPSVLSYASMSSTASGYASSVFSGTVSVVSRDRDDVVLRNRSGVAQSLSQNTLRKLLSWTPTRRAATSSAEGNVHRDRLFVVWSDLLLRLLVVAPEHRVIEQVSSKWLAFIAEEMESLWQSPSDGTVRLLDGAQRVLYDECCLLLFTIVDRATNMTKAEWDQTGALFQTYMIPYLEQCLGSEALSAPRQSIGDVIGEVGFCTVGLARAFLRSQHASRNILFNGTLSVLVKMYHALVRATVDCVTQPSSDSLLVASARTTVGQLPEDIHLLHELWSFVVQMYNTCEGPRFFVMLFRDCHDSPEELGTFIYHLCAERRTKCSYQDPIYDILQSLPDATLDSTESANVMKALTRFVRDHFFSDRRVHVLSEHFRTVHELLQRIDGPVTDAGSVTTESRTMTGTTGVTESAYSTVSGYSSSVQTPSYLRPRYDGRSDASVSMTSSFASVMLDQLPQLESEVYGHTTRLLPALLGKFPATGDDVGSLKRACLSWLACIMELDPDRFLGCQKLSRHTAKDIIRNHGDLSDPETLSFVEAYTTNYISSGQKNSMGTLCTQRMMNYLRQTQFTSGDVVALLAYLDALKKDVDARYGRAANQQPMRSQLSGQVKLYLPVILEFLSSEPSKPGNSVVTYPVSMYSTASDSHRTMTLSETISELSSEVGSEVPSADSVIHVPRSENDTTWWIDDVFKLYTASAQYVVLHCSYAPDYWKYMLSGSVPDLVSTKRSYPKRLSTLRLLQWIYYAAIINPPKGTDVQLPDGLDIATVVVDVFNAVEAYKFTPMKSFGDFVDFQRCIDGAFTLLKLAMYDSARMGDDFGYDLRLWTSVSLAVSRMLSVTAEDIRDSSQVEIHHHVWLNFAHFVSFMQKIKSHTYSVHGKLWIGMCANLLNHIPRTSFMEFRSVVDSMQKNERHLCDAWKHTDVVELLKADLWSFSKYESQSHGRPTSSAIV